MFNFMVQICTFFLFLVLVLHKVILKDLKYICQILNRVKANIEFFVSSKLPFRSFF